MRILLTEDHLDTVKIMRILLERHGMTVQTAGTVSEALQLIETEEFDLLISDMRLPDGDGFELSRMVRDRKNLKSICLSGDASVAEDELHRDSAFSAFLSKPLDLNKLLEAIEAIRMQA